MGHRRSWRDWPAWPFLLLLAIAALAGLSLLTGCSTRESAKALVQADQAVEGAGAVLTAPAVVNAVAQLPPDVQQVVTTAIQTSLDLLSSARTSLAPGIAILGQGKPVQVDTTAQQAAAEPKRFIVAAAGQAGRAQQEAEDLAWWRQVGGAVLQVGQAAAGSWLSQALLAAGGLSGVVAIGLKALAVIRTKTQAVQDAVAAGDELAQASPDQVAEVKAAHLKRQMANGTHGEIAKALAAKRAQRA